MKSLLLINQSSPYNGNNGQESLDLAMAASNFGQPVSLLFIDDGIFQLVEDQQPEHIGIKHFSKGFAALTFYDIENIYVCEQSIKRRNISLNSLCIPTEVLTPQQVAALLATEQVCLRF